MENPQYITLEEAKEAFCSAIGINTGNEGCNSAKFNLFVQKITDFSQHNEQNHYKQYLKVFLTTWSGKKEAKEMTAILKGDRYKECKCISAIWKEKTVTITVSKTNADRLIKRLSRSWALVSVEEISHI